MRSAGRDSQARADRPVTSAVTMVETKTFRELVAALRDGGHAVHARRIEDVLDATHTTSSELIAELGRVVLEVRRGCSPLNADQRRLIKDCLRQVHRVWPGFGGLRGLFLRWFS
jgi:hypothetical protein